jgi:Cu(I)/Ag(I) efflux system protein CusF
MKTSNTTRATWRNHQAATLLALLLGSGIAFAQTHDHTHGAPTAPTATPAATAPVAPAASGLPWAEAEVRRVDAAAGKISLKHGDIKNLDMPPMSMVFQLQDKALLGNIKAGDRVRFTADQVNGSYTVLEIQPIP